VGSITIRRIDDDTKAWLRTRAARAGRSVESELRHIIARERSREEPSHYPPGMEPRPGEGVGTWMHRISRPGFELDLPDGGLFELRDPYRDPD
jgi:hypothetical protein